MISLRTKLAPMNPPAPVTKMFFDDIMVDMIDTKCAICGNNQQTEILYPATFTEQDLSYHTYSARRLPDRVHFRFLRCKRCTLIFSSPILPHEKIEKLYKRSVFNYDDQVPYLNETYLRYFEKILKFLPNNPKILEIGCGNGFFLEYLKAKKGFTELYGVEPGKPSVAQAPAWLRKNIKIDIFKSGQYSRNSFDVVCTFHTLDHIVELNSFLEESYKILRKGGIFMAIIHDTDGLSVKLFKEKSPIFDIEHIYLFNKQNISKLAKKHKLHTEDVFNVENLYPLSYWARMTPSILNSRKYIGNFLKTTGLGNISFKLGAGNIGIIARK